MVRSFSYLFTSGLLTISESADDLSLLQSKKLSKLKTVDTADDMWKVPACLYTCLENGREDVGCGECVEDIIQDLSAMAEDGTVISNGLPLKYFVDMVGISKRPSYTDAWCDGKVEGCGDKPNFPGPGSTSVQGHERVSQMVRETPEKEWDGTWWRGNELGFIINNPIFWSKMRINPVSISLGINPQQHWVIRPFIEKLFTVETRKFQNKKTIQDMVDSTIKSFLENRLNNGQTIKVMDDLTVLSHQILFKMAFDREITWEKAASFVDAQGKMVKGATILQILPDELYKDCGLLNVPCKQIRKLLDGVTDQITSFVDEYAEILKDFKEDPAVFKNAIETPWAEQLAAYDSKCEPSESCLRQLAAGVWDTFYAAGGLSVPTIMGSGLAVLFSEHESNPFTNKESFVPEKNSEEFFWEVLRYFPPVGGFPHWTTRPTCKGMTAAETAALNGPDGTSKGCPGDAGESSNQYEGGVRWIPNLPMAQRDPAVWGANADQFVIRDYKEYYHSVGFAEPAYRPDFLDGRMNRNCPGRNLSMMIGESFFRQFRQDQWYVNPLENNGQGPNITSGPGWFTAFELAPKGIDFPPKEDSKGDKVKETLARLRALVTE